ncbi:IclR family transcriptional regulator C-terminal domain-containing protein [Streptomyces sp. NPDC007205]|uniref:IclR family transcriptional regulator domain-containing protein n=1 Tax=Streptomyces sp. NPDC007205 TaxID=3154316 RepID=UPI0033D80781
MARTPDPPSSVWHAQLVLRDVHGVVRSAWGSAHLFHLERVHASGVAVEVGEFQGGLSCLAAPVFDAGGRVAGAVATSVPVELFEQRQSQLQNAVRVGAARVSRLIAATVSSQAGGCPTRPS